MPRSQSRIEYNRIFVRLREVRITFNLAHICGLGEFSPLQISLLLLLLLPAGSAAGSSAGIVFTHVVVLGFFAPQGRHAAPINVKFGREERTVALLPAKYHLDRLRGGGLRPPKLKKMEFYQYNCT